MLLQEANEVATSDGETRGVAEVRAAITQLPPVERDLLVLRYRDDLDIEALAARTQVDPGRVRRWLHHAAWVVEDLAGPASLEDRVPRMLGGRPLHLVEEDAALGITPQLAARLSAAVQGEVPAADEHWRARALLRGLRSHADGLLIALALAAVVLPVAASLVSL